MQAIKLNYILKAVDGDLIQEGKEKTINHVVTNSKEIKEGSLFVPIVGEHFDAHDFIQSAFESGAVASFASKEIDLSKISSDKTIIKVHDTKLALQALATWYRENLKLPIIAVTGSVGKTSTKEMIAAAISKNHKVLKTKGNQNSQIGVPLTIFNIENFHDFAVVEMGMSEFGEMERIAKVAKPNFCVITNIGISHIENLKTKENILKEKLNAANYIGKDGILFLNADDELLLNYYNENKYKKKIILFGENKISNYRAYDTIAYEDKTKFKLRCPYGEFNLEIPTIGKHNVTNALAAIAVAFNLGLNINEIQQGLLSYKSLKMRQEIYKKNSITIIDDSYNASPDSFKSGINVLNSIKANRKVLVVADMLELGELSNKAHFDIGVLAAKNNINCIFAIGKFANFVCDGAKETNKSTETIKCENNTEAYEQLKQYLKPNDAVLIKGSRGMHTDEIVKKLLK